MTPIFRVLVLAFTVLVAGCATAFSSLATEADSATDLVVRNDFGVEIPEGATPTLVLRFAQISDAHVLDDDAPYPLRQEILDPINPPFGSAQRPQEEYTDEMVDATVRALNDLNAVSPITFAINTGDNVDNSLENEVLRFVDLTVPLRSVPPGGAA